MSAYERSNMKMKKVPPEPQKRKQEVVSLAKKLTEQLKQYQGPKKVTVSNHPVQ